MSKYWGVVNTGRPLQVKYWGVATPATPAALTPMVELLQVSPDQFVFFALRTSLETTMFIVYEHQHTFVGHLYQPPPVRPSGRAGCSTRQQTLLSVVSPCYFLLETGIALNANRTRTLIF